jgi:hypothetical protein
MIHPQLAALLDAHRLLFLLFLSNFLGDPLDELRQRHRP